MDYVRKAAENKRLMKLICKIYDTPGALKQIETELRTQGERKGLFAKRVEGPVDSKDVKELLKNPTTVTILTALCAEKAMYAEAMKAYVEAVKRNDNRPELVDEANKLAEIKDKKVAALVRTADKTTSLDEFSRRMSDFLVNAMEATENVVKHSTVALESPTLSEEARTSMEPIFDAPRIEILEQLKGDERTVAEIATLYKALKAGKVDDISVSSKFSFSDMAKMFSDKSSRDAFLAVGKLNKEESVEDIIGSYKSEQEKAAVEAAEQDVSEATITFTDYDGIIPDDLSDQEFLSRREEFFEKMILTSVYNRANANVELRKAVRIAEENHAMNVKTGKLTRVSTYGEDVNELRNEMINARIHWNGRLLSISHGENSVEKEVRTGSEIIARYGNIPSILEKYKGVVAQSGAADREAAKARMESRKDMSVRDVLSGSTVINTTNMITSQLTEKGETDKGDKHVESKTNKKDEGVR